MAVTKGQGNPRWTRDETILALNLYLKLDGNVPGPKHEEIIALSDLLNRLPIHPLELRRESFRNPDGVAFKLQNIRSVATGEGLKNSSKMDKAIWKEFGHNPTNVRVISDTIISNIGTIPEHEELLSSLQDDEVFYEGRIITTIHKMRERNPDLRKKIIKIRKRENKIHCDICGMKNPWDSLIKEEDIFECHHIIPLYMRSEGITAIEDIAFLCRNCHKALHSYISHKKEWILPTNFKKKIEEL